MQKYNTLLKNCIKKKYKGITLFKKKLYESYLLQRNKDLIFIKKRRNLINEYKKDDHTHTEIKGIYNSKFYKKKEEKILIFFKKFETHLSLKKSYNSRYKKNSNIETCVSTYIFLGLSAYKNRVPNKLQKLNCILKILDKILIEKKNSKKCNYHNLSELINIEKKMLKELINEK